MKTPLRILHVEDNEIDANLIQSLIEEQGIVAEFQQVQTRSDFLAALSGRSFDLILADYTLPSFDGMSALEMAHGVCPGIPFIFVSGTMGEEIAIQSLKKGAFDYLLKDRLSRLGASIQRAVEDAEKQRTRRLMEEELRQRDELFRSITENVDDLIVVLDVEGRHIYQSASYRKLLDDFKSLPGSDSFADVHPEDRAQVRLLFRKTVQTGKAQRAEYRLLLKNNSVRHIESSWNAIRDSEGHIRNVVHISRDVTERRIAEERLRDQALLLDKARDAICVTEMDQRILYWNKGAEHLYGWSTLDAVGQNLKELQVKGEARMLEILKSLISQDEWQGELDQNTKSGRNITVASRWTLLRDDKGNPKRILVINNDVTEKKLMEIHFLRSQRLESIGTLAGGIAHDLNNILTPVLMAAELLETQPLDEFSQSMLHTIKGSVERGSGMVKQILTFARGAAGDTVSLELDHLIREVVKLAADTFPRSITVQSKTAEDLWPVAGDAIQLHQVLLNLCVNARDAMPKGGILRIEAENTLLKGKTTRMVEGPVSGRYLKITVSDTGEGILPHLIDKVFEPFFTTKEPEKGTGLGLSTVLNILRAHQGFIEVVSQTGKKTAFTIFIPAADSSGTALEQEQPAPLPKGQGEHILIVDDELALLEMMKETLESSNYQVVMARNGAEAASLYSRNKDLIQLVISDLMMPVMGGPELIRVLHQLNPHLKIICISGLASEGKLDELDKSKICAFLTKPFSLLQLLSIIREVMAGDLP